MNYTLKCRLLQFTTFLQRDLFAWQKEEELKLTPKLQEVICRQTSTQSSDYRGAD